MITSQRTLRTISVATLFVTSMVVWRAPLEAGTPATTSTQRRHAPVVNTLRQNPATARQSVRQPARRQSVIAQAATGKVIDGLPQPPLDGSLVEVEQAGLVSYAPACGPVCGCDACMADAACGVDVLHEPGCGIEIGCGIGALVDTYGPLMGRACCDEGCDQCCDTGVIEHGCGIDGTIVQGPGCGMETHGACSCDACTSCDIDCVPLFLPMLRIQWNRFDFFGGVQGFKGPLNFANTGLTDRNGSGSFGFYQGFNHARSIKGLCRGWDIATQLGVRTTQSNLSGAEFSDETRNQVFVTAGFFRRVDLGLQYGLVVDYLNQDWYFNGDLTQLRGELSWRFQNQCHVAGFQFMAALSHDTSSTTVRDQSNNIFNSSVSFESTDQYRFFYRRLLRHNGTCNAFAGWTDQNDTLLGADFSMPIQRRVALAGGVTYLIPEQGDGNGGNEEEGWNLSLGFIFRPCGHNGAGRYSRPLFDVADNGTFMVDRR